MIYWHEGNGRGLVNFVKCSFVVGSPRSYLCYARHSTGPICKYPKVPDILEPYQQYRENRVVQAESLLTLVATLQFRVSKVGGAIGCLKPQSASELDEVDPSKGVEERHVTKPCLSWCLPNAMSPFTAYVKQKSCGIGSGTQKLSKTNSGVNVSIPYLLTQSQFAKHTRHSIPTTLCLTVSLPLFRSSLQIPFLLSPCHCLIFTGFPLLPPLRTSLHNEK
jgi:hypothetical protein